MFLASVKTALVSFTPQTFALPQCWCY